MEADKKTDFTRLIDQYKDASRAVSYKTLFDAYLESDLIHSRDELNKEYQAQLDAVVRGELECDKVDWHFYTTNNFFSIKPHLSAQSCFEATGHLELAKYHEKAIKFIKEGILDSGVGDQSYSSYEVLSWTDAFDFLEESDYEVVDIYSKSFTGSLALYLQVVVNEPQTGLQKELSFDNNRLLHRILEIPFPFAALNKSLELKVVDPLSKDDSIIKMSKAGELAEQEQWQEAASLFEDVAQRDSAVANYKLGLICLKGVAENVLSKSCEEYAMASANQGLIDGYILQIYMYGNGLTVDKNLTKSKEAFRLAQQGSSVNDIWYRLATVDYIVDGNRKEYYLKKAAEAGNLDAQYRIILTDSKNNDPEQAHKIINTLTKLAEQGHMPSQLKLARKLLWDEKGEERVREQAYYWIEQAVKSQHPDAYYLKGEAFEYGYFAKADYVAAFEQYEKAAYKLFPSAQWKLGQYYFHGISPAKESDEIAVAWYGMCALSKLAKCQYSLGRYFKYVARNYDRARYYFELATQQNHLKSEFELALLYEFGDGVQVDKARARKLYEGLCQRNLAKACEALSTKK